MSDPELAQFKVEISLVEYAIAEGYSVGPRSSSNASITMRHEEGDKILISVAHDGHWIYCSVRSPDDRGSIIDFVQARRGLSLGQVRHHLRPWLGGKKPLGRGSGTPPPPKPTPSIFEQDRVMSTFAAAAPLTVPNSYLTGQRRVPASVYLGHRFVGRLRVDGRHNVLFPHWGGDRRLTGYEVKNAGFTGFAKHGRKGLFGSSSSPDDTELVIAESGIDLLSFAALFGTAGKRMISTAGAMSPATPPIVRSAMAKMPSNSVVVAATDNDAGGDALSEQVELVFRALGRRDLDFQTRRPGARGDDWNDVLRACGDPS